jgi:hypothetical protein
MRVRKQLASTALGDQTLWSEELEKLRRFSEDMKARQPMLHQHICDQKKNCENDSSSDDDDFWEDEEDQDEKKGEDITMEFEEAKKEDDGFEVITDKKRRK